MYSIQRNIPGDPSWIPVFKLSSRLETREKNRSGNRRCIPVETRRYVHIRMMLPAIKFFVEQRITGMQRNTVEDIGGYFLRLITGYAANECGAREADCNRHRASDCSRTSKVGREEQEPWFIETHATNWSIRTALHFGRNESNSLWKSHCLPLLHLFCFLLISFFFFIVYFIIVVGTMTMWKRRLQMRYPGIWRNVKKEEKIWKQKFSRLYSSEIIGLRRNDKDGQITNESIQQRRHEVRLV